MLPILGALVFSSAAFAATGDITITVNDEMGNPLTSATVTAQCTEHGGTLMTGLTTNGSGQVTISNATAVANGCDEYDTEGGSEGTGDADSITVNVSKNGYVSKSQSFSSVWHDHNDPGASVTVTNVQFAVKVTVSDELSAAFTGGLIQTGDSAAITCLEGTGGNYYCAVPLSHTITAVQSGKIGFVQQTLPAAWTDRTANSDAQRTVSVTNMEYGHVIEVDNELDQSLSGATVTGGSGNTACVASGSTYYCAIPPAEDDSSSFTVAKDGYVTRTNITLANRTDATSEQQEADADLLFAVKVTGATDELGNSINLANVDTGNSYGVQCQESSNTWYCAVPLAHTGVTVRGIKDGYVANTSTTFTDRTSATDGQQSVSLSNVLFAYKVTAIQTEAIEADVTSGVSTLELGDNSGRNTCTLSSGTWYCPVSLSNSDGTIIARVVNHGYVEKSDYATTGFAIRDDHTDAQDSGTIGGIQYAYRFSQFTSEVIGADISDDVTTVAIGGYTCQEDEGEWYCAVPSDEGDVSATVTVDGYVEESLDIDDRTSSTDAQVTESVDDIKYAYKFTFDDELNHDLSNALVESNDGADYNIICLEAEGGGTWYCAVPINSGWGEGAEDSTYVSLEKDGYVTRGISTETLRTSHSDAQISQDMEGVAYSHRVTLDREGDNAALSGATLTIGEETCEEGIDEGDQGTGVYYCAIELNGDGDGASIAVSKTGYENTTVQTDDRTQHTNAQVTYSKTAEFQLKVVVEDELDNDLDISGLTYVFFNGWDNTPDYTSGNTAYWAEDTLGGHSSLIITKEGYIDADASNGGWIDANVTGGVQTGPTNGQTVVSLTNSGTIDDLINNGDDAEGSGLKFAQKVLVTRAGDNDPITNAVVTAGVNAQLSGGVTCVREDFGEEEEDGYYYCPVPTSNTNSKTLVAAPGYVTKQITFTPRQSDNTAQRSITAVLDGQGDNDDVTAEVYSQWPANETNVSVNIQPTVSFTSNMNSGTLNSQTVQLLEAREGEGIYGEQVPATVLYNSSSATVTLAPHSPLQPNTAYWIYVNGAKDTAGNFVATYNNIYGYHYFIEEGYEPLEEDDQPQNWFMTGDDESDDTAPDVYETNPANETDNVSDVVRPTITFTEAIKPEYFSSEYIMLKKDLGEGSEQVSASVESLIINGRWAARITPDEALDAEAYYFIEIAGNIEDLAGNYLLDYEGSWSGGMFRVAEAPTGELEVTGISSTQSYATANNDYDDGFEWIFNITVPTAENRAQLKFSDFISGSNSITANNIRYCSEESTNYSCGASDEWIDITGANSYGEASLNLDTDLSSSYNGRQIRVRVQMKVPNGTAGGSYSGSYGVQSEEWED